MKNRISRREFLTTAGALAALGMNAFAWADTQKAGQKTLRLGVIGCGWYGMENVYAAFRVGGAEIVSLCDVDRQHLEKSADIIEKMQSKRPKTFKYYEDLLEMPGMDAIIIATPPHWHALPFIAACKKGFDIYCEKPLAYDIREAQAMIAAAKKSGKIVQIGFQRRQSAAFQAVKKYIQEGHAGKIIQVDANIHFRPEIKNTTPQVPPVSLDWDLWCGPAPKLPYCEQIGHFNWRLEKNYGNGHLVDWGIHLIDATRFILGESMPSFVQAMGGIYYFKNQITTPDILTAHFDFKQCPVVWKHRMFGPAEYMPETSNGIFFYGEKETIFVGDSDWFILSKDPKKPKQSYKMDVDMPKLHMADFFHAVRTRQQPSCQIEDAFASCASVQLGMISYNVESKIAWEEKTCQITNNEKASKLLKREYRSPWKHPYKSVADF